MPDREPFSEAATEDIAKVTAAIIQEITVHPPTVALVGISGVGKSSTINTLFRTSLPTSDTVPLTKEFVRTDCVVPGTTGQLKGVGITLRVYDAPGLGADTSEDAKYLDAYRHTLGECDIVLWILGARNRGIALDQIYLRQLSKFHDKMIFAINQVDLIEPINWDERINLPSKEQETKILEIIEDRRLRIERVLRRPVRIEAYSAKRRYRLQALFATILETAPADRAWLFDVIKNFSFDDFVPERLRETVKKAAEKRRDAQPDEPSREGTKPRKKPFGR